MVENSSAGLTMLGAEVPVTVTKEERHQDVLARYPVAAGAQRRVAVELAWCTIDSGKYRGEHVIEVRLDGHRVGELTRAMSQRYAPIVDVLSARGARPGCEAVIQRGTRGLELVLRLPRDASGAVPVPPPAPAAVPVPVPVPAPQRRSTHRPLWIAAAVIAAVFVIALVGGNDEDSPGRVDNPVTTSVAVPTTSVAPATTTRPAVQATTTVAQPPPAPRTTTEVAAPPPPPPPPPADTPKKGCDPNYSGCVPVASDVDCEGGTGDGPAYVTGPIKVIGTDIYRLDHDKDGIACE